MIMANRIQEQYMLRAGSFLILIILLLPTLARLHYQNNLLIGDEAYYHLRIANDALQEKSFTFVDHKIVNERLYTAHPYHLVLGALSLLIGGTSASKLLPPLLGVIAFLLFSLLLRYFGMEADFILPGLVLPVSIRKETFIPISFGRTIL